SAEFQNDKKKEIFNLKILGNEVDVKSTGEMALFSLNKFKITEKIFQVLKAGKFETIKLYSESEKLDKLFKDSNFNIEGNMKDGDINVPHIDFDFNNVSGYASIKKGVLNGKNLNGKMGSSIIRDGTLSLGLGKDNDILKINADIDANLSEITPHLKRLIKNEKFLKFLSSLENLKGNANGKLILGDKKSSLKPKVKVNKFNLTVNYPKIPFEIKISGDDLEYEKSYIKFNNVKGNISETIFTDLTGKYDWANESDLEITSVNSDISFKELNAWISQFDKYSDYFKRYKKAKGVISVSDLHFSRLVSDPEKWNLNFKSEGTIHDTEKLNYSLLFKKTPGELVIDNLKLKDGNSDAELSLDFNDKYYQINYSGILAEETLSKYSPDNAFSFGLLEGEISINYIKNRISKSTANGKLKGEKIVIPFKEYEPIKIESFNLNTVKNKINFESLNLLLRNIGLDLAGTLYSDKDKIKFDLEKGSACDVITTGNFAIDDKILEMNFDASSENKQFEETLNCFFDDSERISGNYDLQAQINSNGNIDNIRGILNGEFTLNIKDGKVPNNHKLLLTILKVTNITQIYRGKLPDFESEGLKFSKIDIKGDIEKGVIKIKDATFESPYVEILFGGYINLNNEEYDIKFNVAVLQIIHDVLKKVPLLKRLKAENIISIPVRVKGQFNKPDTQQYYKE
ncbi:MAG: AsmA-like C-terminal domain-containing protein, partial [Thermodesulfobacteriota bacterium]